MEWLISEGTFNRNRKSASKQAILFNTFGGGELISGGRTYKRIQADGLITLGANKWEGLQAAVYGMFTPIMYSK